MDQPTGPVMTTLTPAPHELSGRVAILEKGMTDLTANVQDFMLAQRQENSRLHETISKLGEGFRVGLDDVKNALNARGRVTGQFILTMIGVAAALLVAIGGFGNFFITSAVNSARQDTASARQEVAQVRQYAQETRESEQHGLQQLNIDLQQDLKKLQEYREADLQDQIKTLREQRDKAFDRLEASGQQAPRHD